ARIELYQQCCRNGFQAWGGRRQQKPPVWQRRDAAVIAPVTHPANYLSSAPAMVDQVLAYSATVVTPPQRAGS
ncbi:MAG: hypothetical protein ACRYGK_14645, partial [Janthinobacterium lividum]